jgi:hypothetical protein
MAAIIQLVQSGWMPRTGRASEQIETLATDAMPRAVRATEQIETLVTDAIILIRPTSINALGVYCDPGLRLAAANRTMKLSRRGQFTKGRNANE